MHLESYLPRFQNQAICYAGEDMNNVKALMMLFFYLCIAIIAFVFGVTTSSTIAKEANAIGTLRASGFTRLELLRHYLAVPLLVTIAAVLIGNILGFTVLKGVNAAIYYNNYSLPSYTTLWDPGTVATTTIIPPLLMLAIDGLILWRRLSLNLFDGEGVQRLGQLAGDDLSGVFESIRRQKAIDESPRSFSERAEGTSGSVKYLIETTGIVAR